MLKASDLAKVGMDRCKANHDTYKVILDQCYDSIKRCNNMLIYQTQYAVPDKMPGRPVYNQLHAVKYVYRKLQRGGFQVVPLLPQVLYISWQRPSMKFM